MLTILCFSQKMDKEMNLKILQTVNFVSLEDVSSLSFMEDVHSWKWYWPSGKRYMVVGLGVRLYLYLFNNRLVTCYLM